MAAIKHRQPEERPVEIGQKPSVYHVIPFARPGSPRRGPPSSSSSGVSWFYRLFDDTFPFEIGTQNTAGNGSRRRAAVLAMFDHDRHCHLRFIIGGKCDEQCMVPELVGDRASAFTQLDHLGGAGLPRHLYLVKSRRPPVPCGSLTTARRPSFTSRKCAGLSLIRLMTSGGNSLRTLPSGSMIRFTRWGR